MSQSGPTRPSPRARILVLAAGGGVWALALVLRLGDLQVRQEAFLRGKAEHQQERVMKLFPMRGFIYDRRGEVLAASTEVDSVFAAPTEIKDAAGTARVLADALGGEPGRYLPRLQTRGAFVWIKRKVTPEESRRLRDRMPPGVYLMPESKRLYPKGSLAAHVLGYVGLDGDGLAGLEQHYDRYIQGSAGLMLALRDARGSQYRNWIRRPPVHGMDLTLTIDEVVQHIAEREVERCHADTDARGVIAIVLDPNSGRILALANAPTFDPNEFQKANKEAWRDRAILDTYEPGSTFKTITAASALNRGLVKPWEQIFCENGSITVARTRINDHDPYGWLTFREIISKSSNVGAIKVGLRIPQDAFYKDIRAFGFGARTGIDLPGESPGLLQPPERWSKLSQASMSMGQEIGATPLQMVLALSAIGNGGRLYRPYIVERITGSDGSTWMRNAPTVAAQALSPPTAALLAEIMKGVVADGTGKAADIPGLQVAGKTGTAQKVVGGTYSHTKFMSSFIGFVPAHEPRLCIGIFVDEPRGKYYGGQVAAPVFKRIAEPVLRTMGIPVGLVGSDSETIVESSVGGAHNLVRVYVPEPSAKVAKHDATTYRPAPPPPAGEAPTLAAITAVPPAEAGRVPNLVGQSLRDALRIVTDAGLELEPQGSGVAVRQEPAAGSMLAGPRPVTVYFEGG